MAFKIAIVGTGPAGCMLGRLLHQADVSVTIFEAEPAPDDRSQGGSLDLHSKTGLAAIRDAGLWEQFVQWARYDSQALAVVDRNAKAWFSLASPRAVMSKPEIDRVHLRRVLYQSLPQGTIRWGHRLERVDGDTLVFPGSRVSGFHLVVGADGAWSRVRPAVTSITPVYSGVGGHQLKIPDAEATAPEVHKLVDRGTVFALDEGKELGLQQLGDGAITVSFWTVRREDWREASPRVVSGGEAARRAILDDMEGWHGTLRGAVDKATAACQARSLYMLPVGTRWQHREGVTLVGDAAHLMLHCAGEGVNLALQDARTLARAIIRASREGGPDALDGCVAEFEEDMFKRARKAQEMTDKMRIASFYTPCAPRGSMPGWVLARAKYDVHPLVYPLAFAWFHVFYLLYKLFNPHHDPGVVGT
ncbi:hypothetical protein J3458_013352 [Metarhizium acridum]|uniref:uncharacterized protein n=1 Tax=Metarhizium acridum TaxID=92637 RepID=UPI001C6C4AAB|nr:hypothetical protein J3458_013352 [Metarhizium acridum]